MSGNIVITQGGRHVSADTGIKISTLLGSCVACCLWDPLVRAGGMNHMLIPRRADHANFHGINEMELLINDLLKLGCLRGRMQAKLFGGARMVGGLSDIGDANCEFAMQFLEKEGIACVARSLGGSAARQVVFTPATGAARQRMTRDVPPEPIKVPVVPRSADSGIELF